MQHHKLSLGEHVLLKQKSAKHISPYDPEPYTVTQVVGHQITTRRHNQVKTSDAQKWKKVVTKHKQNYNKLRQQIAEHKLLLHYGDDPVDIYTTTQPDVAEVEAEEIVEDEIP